MMFLLFTELEIVLVIDRVTRCFTVQNAVKRGIALSSNLLETTGSAVGILRIRAL